MNWGTKIVLGMATFMLFIIAMASYMFYVHGRDALIEDDYYEQGINYNKEFDATQHTLNADAEPEIKLLPQQIVIKMKDSASYELFLKRASNNVDDKKYTGNTISNANLILINRTDLPKGLWFLKLQWQVNGKDFMFKRNLTL
ncbi:FixH family protein [Pedobacter chinensis]|nr:FixH family protein [Pedobacter chinensis]